MLRFRRSKTLQKFSSVHAAFHNHFNQERHLVSRNDYKIEGRLPWRSGSMLQATLRLLGCAACGTGSDARASFAFVKRRDIGLGA